MPDIDLESPGKIVASCDNAKDYTFYIVADKAWYTNKAFEANPNCVAGKDLYYRSNVMPDKDGNAEIDIRDQAEMIKHKMADDGTRKAKLVALASSRPGNEDPTKKMAVAEPYLLKKIPPSIKVTVEDDKTTLNVGFKVGMKIEFHGIDSVSLSTMPAGMITLPVSSMTKTDVFDVIAAKNGKCTFTVMGTSDGGNLIKQTVDFQCDGPSVKIAATGYVESDEQITVDGA